MQNKQVRFYDRVQKFDSNLHRRIGDHFFDRCGGRDRLDRLYVDHLFYGLDRGLPADHPPYDDLCPYYP